MVAHPTPTQDRVFEMAERAEAGFFGPVEPGLVVDVGDFRWRFSRDAWEALCAETRTRADALAGGCITLLGVAVEVDDVLPPNSIILEPF